MLNVNAMGQSTTTASYTSAIATTLQVPSGMGAMFDPGTGNHYYMTIRGGGAFERVKVVGRVGDTLTLAGRGEDNSVPRAWPVGACLKIEWNPQQMCEFVQNCMNNAASPTGVTPQTVCMASCKCITVGADGRITSITGSDTC